MIVGQRRGGAQSQGRAGGAHRRRHEGGRHRRHLAPSAGRRPRRRQDGDAVPPGAGGDARCMSARRSRWWSRRAPPRRRTPPISCRSNTRSCTPVVDLDAAMKAATQLHADAPGNLCVDWPGMVPSEDNEREVAAIIKGAPHVARVRVVQPAHGGGFDGDARRHRRIRRGERQLHAARLLAERRRLARPGGPHHGRAERKIAGDHRKTSAAPSA